MKRKDLGYRNALLYIIVILSLIRFAFYCEKDHDAVGISEWISQIQEVCSNLVLTSIGGTMDKNLLTKTYSTVRYIKRESSVN